MTENTDPKNEEINITQEGESPETDHSKEEQNSENQNNDKKKNFDKDKNKILEQRALELAKEVDDSREDDEFINIVEFLLNDEVYAFEAGYTKLVASLDTLTPIPFTPDYVIGVTAVQEQIISVLDIRSFFQMNKRENTKHKKMVVLGKENIAFAVAADDVIGIKKIFFNTIQKTVDTFDDIRKKFFYGLTGEQTIILDAEKILDDQDIIVK
ncbi:MAG: chemotaxis protein CheW [Victivallales bacterium]|nr:chemotaxis protein CheW [Victivallales bacterium]